MFPVDFKDKLPRTESYPLRAKELWDALGSVPQSEAIGLSFVRPMHWGRYKERPRSWGKRPTALQVLSATYGGPVPLSITTSNEMITSTFLNRRWHMTVFAVPRELRHRLNKRLLEQTLHELRQWFIQRADLAGEEGGESFSVLYDETPDALRHEVQSNLAPMVLSRKSGRDIGKRC